MARRWRKILLETTVRGFFGLGTEAVEASELLDSAAEAVETLTEAEGTEAAVVMVAVETFTGVVTATVGRDVGAATVEQTAVTGEVFYV